MGSGVDEPLVEAAREHPLDAVAAPHDAKRALEVARHRADKRLRALQFGAADVDLAEALVPGESRRGWLVPSKATSRKRTAVKCGNSARSAIETPRRQSCRGSAGPAPGGGRSATLPAGGAAGFARAGGDGGGESATRGASKRHSTSLLGRRSKAIQAAKASACHMINIAEDYTPRSRPVPHLGVSAP